MSTDFVKLVFSLESAWHGNATERLWAEPLGRGRFRLQNSPFYAFDVSYEDIVLGEEKEGQLYFKSVLFRGGHSTYRIKLYNHDLKNSDFLKFWTPLQVLGCSFEEGIVLSIDVPPSADLSAVHELLEDGKAAGIWDCEEGHCGHPIANAE